MIDWRNRRLIGKLHMGQKTQVRISGEYSESGNVDKGVIQGCPLSPLFSNIYIEEIVRSSTSSTIPVQSNRGIRLPIQCLHSHDLMYMYEQVKDPRFVVCHRTVERVLL